MNEGRKITREQAEACMRDDSRFHVQHYEFIYSANLLGMLGFWRDGEWRRVIGANTVWSDESDRYCIHADHNNTFDRLFGDERELTFEEAWAALGRGEVLFGSSDLGGGFLFKLGSIGTQNDKELQYTNGTKDGRVSECSTWVSGFFGPEGMKFYRVKSSQPEPLTLEALDARVKALEGKS